MATPVDRRPVPTRPANQDTIQQTSAPKITAWLTQVAEDRSPPAH